MGSWSINLPGLIYQAGLHFDWGLVVFYYPIYLCRTHSPVSDESWLPLIYQSQAGESEAPERENQFMHTCYYTFIQACLTRPDSNYK